MAQLLISIFSELDNKAGIGIIDNKKGLVYLQVENFSGQTNLKQIRGIQVFQNRLYAVTPNSLRIYSVEEKGKKPVFNLDKEVVFPEWLLGGKEQADLIPLHVSSKYNRIYIGCNNLASIDELDLEGNFLQRTHLWEMDGLTFDLSKPKKGLYRFGHIRSITENRQGRIYVTIASVSGSDHGVLLDFSNGEVILENLLAPHNGVVIEDSIYILNIGASLVQKYVVSAGEKIGLAWSKNVIPIDQSDIGKRILLRGLAIDDGKVYTSVFNMEKRAENRLPASVYMFNASDGQLLGGVQISEFGEFKAPKVLGIIKSPFEFLPEQTGAVVFEGNNRIVYNEINKRAERVFDGMNTSPSRNHVVIKATNLSLSYKRSSYFRFGANKHLRKAKNFWALQDISFEIYDGEVIGLIGRNGSGKSTLGMLMGGTMTPDMGTIEITGKSQLLSLGVGFRGELTGRENVFINATLLGMNKKEVEARMDEIEKFAELDEFIDEPVRTYSAGMKSRLSFAVATTLEPDILILDEVLSTGDQSFRAKAEQRMLMMQHKAKTVIMVSHNSSLLRKLCSRVIWLEKSRLIMDGQPEVVIDQYDEFSLDPDSWLQKNLSPQKK